MRRLYCGESAILLYGRKDFGSCGKDVIMYILSSREMRQKFYQNNDLKLLGLAGSMKEAYEIVLKLVQMGYNSDCIYEMNDYLEKF